MLNILTNGITELKNMEAGGDERSKVKTVHVKTDRSAASSQRLWSCGMAKPTGENEVFSVGKAGKVWTAAWRDRLWGG